MYFARQPPRDIQDTYAIPIVFVMFRAGYQDLRISVPDFQKRVLLISFMDSHFQ